MSISSPNQQEAKNFVYTYYMPVEGLCSDIEEQLQCCRESWEAYGWKLVVLDETHAKQHSWFELYSIIAQSTPTVNPGNYEYHCFMRWLAMAAIGGGVMIDYDVINLGLTDLSHELSNSFLLTIYQGHVPCCVQGTAEQYLQVCRKFAWLAVNKTCITFIHSRPHVSDMLMLANGFSSSEVKKIRLVKKYPEIGKLVHCSADACESRQKTKVQAMRELMQQHVAKE